MWYSWGHSTNYTTMKLQKSILAKFPESEKEAVMRGIILLPLNIKRMAERATTPAKKSAAVVAAVDSIISSAPLRA